jgi:hypothetical protein
MQSYFSGPYHAVSGSTFLPAIIRVTRYKLRGPCCLDSNHCSTIACIARDSSSFALSIRESELVIVDTLDRQLELGTTITINSLQMVDLREKIPDIVEAFKKLTSAFFRGFGKD